MLFYDLPRFLLRIRPLHGLNAKFRLPVVGILHILHIQPGPQQQHIRIGEQRELSLLYDRIEYLLLIKQ